MVCIGKHVYSHSRNKISNDIEKSIGLFELSYWVFSWTLIQFKGIIHVNVLDESLYVDFTPNAN